MKVFVPLQVLVNGRIHLSVSPPSEPNVLSACGDLGHFLLQQHREVKVCEYGLPIPVQSSEYLHQSGICVCKLWVGT